MSQDPARDIVDGLVKLGALNVQLGVLTAETVLAAGGFIKPAQVDVAPDQAPCRARIEAIALALEQELLGNYELGFQAMLRLNFPRDRLREIAGRALNAGCNAVAARKPADLPGNDAE